MPTTGNTEGTPIKRPPFESHTLKELADKIHYKEKDRGEWDVIDNGDPLRRTMISPPLCDNRGKLIDMAIRLLTISKSEIPQNRDKSIIAIIYDLLDFSAAHNYKLEQMLLNIINEDTE